MSRIDDAVRRAAAAGQQPALPTPAPTPSSNEPLDAAALADQFFASQPLDAMDLANQFLGEAGGDDAGWPPETPRRLPAGAPDSSLVAAPAAMAAAPGPRIGGAAPARVNPASVPAADGSAPRPRSSLFERLSGHVAAKVVIDKGLQANSREQYRRLAATLHHGQMQHGLRVVTVTSALPGEGKTLTSANLAMTLSESYRRRVLLIDADLRRPTVHTIFNVDNSTGLCEGLAAEEERPLPIRQVSEHLSILPAGHPNSDPMAGLISERFQRLIVEARETFDWVIIDTPPVALLTDSRLLASLADGVILVVRAEATSYEIVKKASDSLGRERILGVVLNSALIGPRAASHQYYGGYYYYGAKDVTAHNKSWPARLTSMGAGLASGLTSRLSRFRKPAAESIPAAEEAAVDSPGDNSGDISAPFPAEPEVQETVDA